MKRPRNLRPTALAAAGTLVLAVCAACDNSDSAGGSSSSSSSATAANQVYNAGITGVVNPSTKRGGTLHYAFSSTPDSFDGGSAYYAWTLNFNRLYETPLITYKSCPGHCGTQLVPGLATGLGQESGDGLTWTYHLKQDVVYEDGAPVTARDVKYAVERTFDRSVLNFGPTYFQTLLANADYPGPYKDRAKNLMGLSSVTTPDKYTVQFHLRKPFPDFDYVVAFPQTAPVPPEKDTGSRYQQHVLSTGPYMFQSYQVGKQATLVPNPRWKPSWNPQAKQLVSKIVMDLAQNPADIDNRLLAGNFQVESAGFGVQDATRAKVLANPALKRNADDALGGNLWLLWLNTKMAPLDKIECRRAVQYAANKTDLQTAYGGPVGGGDIASTVLPPHIIGHQKFDLYEATTQPQGDLVKAKQQLAACGRPNGFTIGAAYRNDRPPEVQAVQALQQGLGRVGIKLQLRGFPAGTYFTNFAGVPKYAHDHNIGLSFGGWVADWPNGYGFLDEISNGNKIASAGNTNIAELNDPVVNKLFADANDPLLSQTARTALWSKIDRQIMTDAAIMPILYARQLMYRPPSVTNWYIHPQYGMQDDITLGVK